MSDDPIQILIEQMADEIARRVACLDKPRLHMFMKWLASHCNRMNAATCADLQGEAALPDSLTTRMKSWLASVQVQGLLWEYHLVLDEVNWWSSLDALRLIQILRSEEKD